MPRSSARIHSSIWKDADFLALSAGAQRMYVLALSQPNLSLCGVVSYTAKRWARLSSGGSVRAVVKALMELEEARFVVIDADTEELWIRSFVKHDGILKSPNATAGMKRDFHHIHSQEIREGFLEGLPEDIRQELQQPLYARSAESPPPPPDSSSSSGDDDEGWLRQEAEKRLADRLAKPGLTPVVDRERWIAKAMEQLRIERAAARDAQLSASLESARSFGRNLVLGGLELSELSEKCVAEYGEACHLIDAALDAGRKALAS